MKEKKVRRSDNMRNSSIELLRIIAMIGVVILHYNNGQIGGGFQYVSDGSINQAFLFFSESLFIGSVNLFVMISGYFLCKTKTRRIIKVVELLVQVVVFSEVFYILRVLSGGEVFSIRELFVHLVPMNYFVVLYAVLYFISPYLNMMIETLTKEKFQKLILLLVVLFSVWTIGIDYLESFLNLSLTGASTVGCYGSQSGYTIVNFVLMYIIGAYIGRYGVSIEKGKNLIYILINLLLVFGLSYGEHLLGNGAIVTWNYNHPLIISFAALVLIFVTKYSFESRVVNELAKGAFTCFLFHTACLSFMRIPLVVNKGVPILIFHQVMVSVCLYLISYVIYKIYSLCTGWIFKRIQL